MRTMRLPCLIIIASLSWPLAASAQTYVVRDGDTLSSIAFSHGLTIDELARTNGIDDRDHIEIGQTLNVDSSEGRIVDRGVIHLVKRGVTLHRISAAYKVPLSRLVRANRLRDPDLIRRGAEIFVPGANHVEPIATRRRAPCLDEPVEVYRIHTDETRRIVLTKCDGEVWEAGREEISHFLDRTKNQSAPLLHPRLLQQLKRVVDHFPGRRVEVVSAYRPPRGERASSRHCKAKALDFRIAGISNSRLRDFARSLNSVGVGYYPNSTFVHLDVRERRAFWVDWSGPGEEPRYGTLQRDPAEEVAPTSEEGSSERLRARRSVTGRSRRPRQPRRRSRSTSSPRPSTAGAP